MKIWLITPPLTQLNTPYPATAYLKGFLRTQGYTDVVQMDLGLELVLKLFSREGLERVAQHLDPECQHDSVMFFREAIQDYLDTVDSVIRFLQGKDPVLAYRIVQRTLLPEGPRFLSLQENPKLLQKAFGELGLQDKAKHLASLYLDDLADVIREGIDPQFQLSKYGEKLAASSLSFDPLLEALKNPTVIDDMLGELVDEKLAEGAPDFAAITLPFPGNVLGGLRIAQRLKEKSQPKS